MTTEEYTVIRTEEVDTYVDSRGACGQVLARFGGLGAAREYAAEVADDHHYGVEIVDAETWEVIT